MDASKKVLIITYYWPPSGGAGVQRWLKFAKYLPEFGYKPVIYTPENPEYPVLDPNLEKDIHPSCIVIKQPIWEPYTWYKRLMGMKKTDKIPASFISEKKKNPYLQKLSLWVRGNLLIPDPRVFWVNPSVKFLNDYIKKEQIKTIISTGPPHSMHLIALKIKRLQPNIHWISDFRDPWTNIDFYQELMLTSWADKKNRRLEKEVLQEADVVLTVSNSWAKDLEKISNRNVDVITNGYDEDDFAHVKDIKPQEDYFTIHHMGSMNKDRNPNALWEALSEIIREDQVFKKKLKIKLTGQTDHSVLESIKKYELDGLTDVNSYIPHQLIAAELRTSEVLLLPLNDTPNVQGIIPGKLFEYLAAQRPILAIGMETGDSANIIQAAKAGYVVGFHDVKKMKEVLQILFKNHAQKTQEQVNEKTSQYARKALTKKLVEFIELSPE